MQALARVITTIERSTDWRDVANAVRAFGAPHGYDRFVVWSAAARMEDTIGQIYWVEGDWFGTGDTMDAETYLRRCPVNQHIFKTDQPFFWTKQDDTYRLLSNPRGPGLHGLQTPIFGAGGLKGAVSFGGDRIDSTPPVRLALVALASATFEKAASLFDDETETPMTRLSPREREVMRWVAAGKRQADAAQLLRLSERTVENHLRRIRGRLGASTTAEAIRIALSTGEIEA